MNGFQLASIYLCVDLGRGDARMAQHFLDDSKICSAGEEVCGERVS